MASVEIGSARIMLGMNAGEFTRGAKAAEDAMARLASRAQGMASAIGSVFSGGVLTMGLLSAVRAYGDSEAALAAVEAVVRSTGGTAGFTSVKLEEMARQLKQLTGIDDDKILMDVTKNLLTFTNIVGPVFREAQVAVLNLSTALKQDLQSSAIQLGKALNDPVAGLTALRRVGIQFTESQQEQIKVLMKSGDILGAQKIILKELATEFGSQAETMAGTVKGKLDRAFVGLGDAMEMVGKATAPMALAILNALSSSAQAFGSLPEPIQRATIAIIAATTAMGALAATAAIVGTVFGAISTPVIIAGAVIAGVVGIIVGLWDKIVELASAAEAAFSAFYQSAKTWLYDNMLPVITWLTGAFETMVAPLGFVGGTAMDQLRISIVNSIPATAAAAEAAGQQIGAAMARGIASGAGTSAPGADKAAPALSPEQAVAAVQARAKAEAQAQQQITDAKKATHEAEAELNKQITEGIALAKKLETPRETELRQLAALEAAYKKGKISAEALGKAQTAAAMTSVNAYAQLASNVANSLSSLFSKSKGFAIAAALINTFEAVTKALATYPPPLSYVAAAGALAAGMAQVANIRKTTESGGGGSGSSGASEAVNPNAGGGQGSASQELMVRGLDPNAIMSGASVKDLAQRLLDFQKDGGVVVLK